MSDRSGRVRSRSEQRQSSDRSVMLSANLEAHLINLLKEIESGATSKLVEFQQFIQYAPQEMRLRMLDRVDELPSRGKSS